jgi:hypothetical protein
MWEASAAVEVSSARADVEKEQNRGRHVTTRT